MYSHGIKVLGKTLVVGLTSNSRSLRGRCLLLFYKYSTESEYMTKRFLFKLLVQQLYIHVYNPQTGFG